MFLQFEMSESEHTGQVRTPILGMVYWPMPPKGGSFTI